jgi:hypothetical protein
MKNHIGGQFFGRLTHRPVIGKYEPRIDRRLGLGAAFKQPALDEKAISTLTRRAHGTPLSKLQRPGSGTMFRMQRLESCKCRPPLLIVRRDYYGT